MTSDKVSPSKLSTTQARAKAEFLRFQALAQSMVQARTEWWEACLPTVYLSDAEKLNAVDYMVMMGLRSYKNPRYGAYYDTMLHALNTYEWIRWGNFPRRFQFRQQYTPKGDCGDDWPGYPHVDKYAPRRERDNPKYGSRVDYNPIREDEFDPVQVVNAA